MPVTCRQECLATGTLVRRVKLSSWFSVVIYGQYKICFPRVADNGQLNTGATRCRASKHTGISMPAHYCRLLAQILYVVPSDCAQTAIEFPCTLVATCGLRAAPAADSSSTGTPQPAPGLYQLAIML